MSSRNPFTDVLPPQTQERTLYPKILHLLRPYASPNSATLLGWHAEGPFIQFAKRGAHEPQFLLAAKEDIKSFEEVYGADNLAVNEDWLMGDEHVGVRVITAAPEVDGVMTSIDELTRRGVVDGDVRRLALGCFLLLALAMAPGDIRAPRAVRTRTRGCAVRVVFLLDLHQLVSKPKEKGRE